MDICVLMDFVVLNDFDGFDGFHLFYGLLWFLLDFGGFNGF